MKTKKDKSEPVGVERMTDAELSKQLGSYQRTESIGMLLGVLLVIAGCIMMFVYRNIAVICILVFAAEAQPDTYKDSAKRMQLDSISPEASLMDIDTVDPYRSLYFSLCY